MSTTTQDWTFVRSISPVVPDPDWLGGPLAAVPPNAIVRSPELPSGHIASGLELIWLPYDAAGVFLGGLLRLDNSNITFEPLLGVTDRLGATWVLHGNNSQQIFLGWESGLMVGVVTGLSSFAASGIVVIPRVLAVGGPLNPLVARADLYYRVRAGTFR